MTESITADVSGQFAALCVWLTILICAAALVLLIHARLVRNEIVRMIKLESLRAQQRAKYEDAQIRDLITKLQMRTRAMELQRTTPDGPET